MKLPRTSSKSWALTVAASLAAAATLSGAAFAQGRPAGGTAAGAAPGMVSPDKVLEDKLLGELAGREMDSLLEYYFKKHNVPADRQAAIRSVAAWRELNNPNLPAARRRALLQEGIKGVGGFLASTRDTELLMRRAAQLIESGMNGQVNQIEYFGETPKAQAELNEVADAVIKILDKTIEECEAQQAQVLAGQTRPSPQVMSKWQALDERLGAARWTKAFASYGLALSLDAADPRRRETADAALTFLKEFEDPQYQQEARVKVHMGKLNVVKGDTAAALEKFAQALKVKDVSLASQYEAMYGIALADLLAKKPDPAGAALAKLQAWVGSNLKGEDLKSVSGSVGLLDYRINELRSSLSRDPAEKRRFAEAGEAALSKVMADNPRLAPTIKKMLVDRLPVDADLSKQETVLLQSLMARGVDEVLRAKDAVADDKGRPVLERSIRAVTEIRRRKGQPGVSEDVLDEAEFLEPIFWSKLGNPVKAIEGSLDYLKAGAGNKERASNTLANALGAVESLRKSPESGGERAGELITRTWKLALDSGLKQYAFVYGKRLFDRAKTPADFKAAAAALRAVPESHPAVLHARFYELSALQETLDDKALDAGARRTIVNDVQRLAADVNKRIDAALASAADVQKPRLKFYKVSAMLKAAELLQRESKDNPGVLKMLEGFERTAQGLPQEDKLDGTALRLRVNAYMALGKTQDAVDEVKKLVASQQQGGGGSAAGVLFNMIEQMDDAFAKAKARGDHDAMRQNSAAQVALITPLIEQTKDEAARNRYKQWKAEFTLRAARNEADANRRAQYLTEAQQTFTELMGLAKEGSPQYDTMRYKLALVSFELKDYKKVQQELGQLIASGRLGAPDLREASPDGNDTFRENPVYWEGLLRYMQANWELSKTDNSPQLVEAVTNARDTLKTLYVNRGKNVGGERLRDEYLKLRAEMLPGWDETKTAPPSDGTTKPAPEAASAK